MRCHSRIFAARRDRNAGRRVRDEDIALVGRRPANGIIRRIDEDSGTVEARDLQAVDHASRPGRRHNQPIGGTLYLSAVDLDESWLTEETGFGRAVDQHGCGDRGQFAQRTDRERSRRRIVPRV